MKSLQLFGTREHPLRASSLPKLIQCPWRSVLLFLDKITDESGPAADTGSATHKAIEVWHKSDFDVKAALGAMRDASTKFPLYDDSDAELLAIQYFADPRNRITLFANEQQIEITLPPTEYDPTQKEILIIGTLDQVREESGRLYVHDIKTSKRPGHEIMREHAVQIAAYAVGATQRFGKPCDPGSVIMLRQYNRTTRRAQDAPAGIFFRYPWNLTACNLLLDGVREIVANIRAGRVWANTTDCDYCPAKGPEFCLPMLQELTTK